MKDKIEHLISMCSQMEFGSIRLSQGEKKFCNELNQEIISLCRSLPHSAQTDALLFVMHFHGISFGQELNFFSYYYVPSWSIIYWLVQFAPKGIGLRQAVKRNAKTAHSMTLFLHALDDHLNDREIPTTHLALLLRSQSWMIMNNAISSLADGVDGGHKIVQGFIDDYYSGITSSEKVESLDSYCDLFRKQISTWLMVPTLMTKKVTSDGQFADAIQSAYGSFTISWRLLDDIQDIESDMINGVCSSVYVCLPEDMKNCWDKDPEEKKDKASGCAAAILNYISENRVIERIRDRIFKELESAASIADHYRMTSLADEYRSLLAPLRTKRDPS
ncbi:MAG: hypothetical protein H6Q42_69 [Deltaproteobacteria bacterium]|nr:hypothetical protein [Deltaproteobacteria bacterium]